MELNINNLCKQQMRTRGRPKKNTNISTNDQKNKTKKPMKLPENNELILHLPINISSDKQSTPKSESKNNKQLKLSFDITESSDTSEPTKKCCKKLLKDITNKQRQITQLQTELKECLGKFSGIPTQKKNEYSNN